MVDPTARISRNIFDESKRYVMSILQQDVPWVDADQNDGNMELYTTVRRYIQKFIGDVAILDSFKAVVASSPANNFKLTGGDNTAEGAARAWAGGHPCFLKTHVDYTSANSGVVHSLISNVWYDVSIGRTIIEDSSTYFGYGYEDLAGKTLKVLGLSSDYIITIESHVAGFEATRLVVTATEDGSPHNNLTDVVFRYDGYYVALKTPGLGHTDLIFLDVFLDEVNAEMDSVLLHPDSTLGYEAQRRWCVRQVVQVLEDADEGDLPGSYTDSNGAVHYIFPIATCSHAAGTGNLSDFVDLRTKTLLREQLERFSVAVTPAVNATKRGDTVINFAVSPWNVAVDPTDFDADYLKIFRCGVLLVRGVEYTVDSATQITLAVPIDYHEIFEFIKDYTRSSLVW